VGSSNLLILLQSLLPINRVLEIYLLQTLLRLQTIHLGTSRTRVKRSLRRHAHLAFDSAGYKRLSWSVLGGAAQQRCPRRQAAGPRQHKRRMIDSLFD